jgi:hypothetical protein
METEKPGTPDGGTPPQPKEHFPLFKSHEEAIAHCEKTGDNYYFTAFMLEIWLGDLIRVNVAKYADNDPTKREMQTGGAFRHEVFRDLFAKCQDQAELFHFLQSLLRFAGEDDTFAEIITRTYGLFGTENLVNPVVNLQAIRPGPNAAELMRRYLRRFCDWLDCLLHYDVHFMSYAIPGSFFPGDEEARHLFSLGLSETVLPELSGYDQTFWRWNHETAVKDLTKSDKWKFHADGVKHEAKRHHTHPEVDDCLIGFWPLVKRFNWSYNQLQTALLHVLPHYTGRYPCDCYVSLQKHCTQTLGLKKGTGGQRGPAGKPTKQLEQLNPPDPEGFDVVKAFLANRDAAKRQPEGR